jgi:hypothetical protein
MTTLIVRAPRPWRIAAFADSLSASTTMHGHYERATRDEAARQPEVTSATITNADLAPLPAPVQAWLRRTGVVGRPRVHDFVVEMDADLWRTAEGKPMRTRIVQHSFVDRPARFFYLRTSMFGLPVRGLHAYTGTSASMRIRAAGLFTVVDERGPAMHRAETVTVLNDLCLLAPAALLDSRITWAPVSDHSARVTFANGAVQVHAVLTFDSHGDLSDFSSDDRHVLADDGYRWTTPVRGYRDIGGLRLPAEGDAIWHYTDKPSFRYGRFVIRSVRYNTGYDTRVAAAKVPAQ